MDVDRTVHVRLIKIVESINHVLIVTLLDGDDDEREPGTTGKDNKWIMVPCQSAKKKNDEDTIGGYKS
jgi:hypothetical protein